MWNNTRDYIQNSFNNIGSIFRRDRSNNLIDLDFNFRRRSTIRRSNRRSNRNNCLSRNSSRTLAFNSQLNRELLNASSSTTNASSTNQIIRPPHIHRTRSCHSNNSSLSNQNSNLSSPNSAHNSSFQPLLPTETINSSSFNQTASNSLSSPQPPPSTRSLSPLLPIINNPHYPIIRTSLSPQNVFNQHYLRTFSPRNFCNLNGENQNLIQLTKEKNYLACLINLLVIITIVISVLQPRWFQIQGGICNNRYIGLQEFMFQSNNAQLLNKNSFQLNNNLNSNNNDQKSNTAQNIPKINYFKLTDEILNKVNSSSNLEINSSSLNQITHNKTINLLDNYKKNHTYLITSTQSSIQNIPIHLPAYQPPTTTQKSNINLFRNYDKIRRSNDESQIQFYKTLADHYQNQVSNDCLSPEILGLQRLIIILCIFVIFSSLIQLLLDLIVTTNKYMNLLREHAIFNLISVIICIMIIGITYLLSNLLTKEQIQKHLLSNQNRPYYSTHHKLGHPSSINFFNLDKDDNQHIEVRLEISYYLIIFAGIFSLVAAICNLFNNKPNLYLININSDQEANSLLNGDPHQINSYWSHNQNLRNLILNSGQYNFIEPPPPYSN